MIDDINCKAYVYLTINTTEKNNLIASYILPAIFHTRVLGLYYHILRNDGVAVVLVKPEK